jgi:hypothetical protein
MIKKWLIGGLMILGCGCETMNNTEKGTAIGGAAGTVLGAGIGAIAHHPVIGALIGAGGGMLAGSAVGASQDRKEARQAAQAYAATRPPLTIPDVVQMAQSHVSDDVIIQQIRTTGSTFRLTSDDVIYLSQMGVSNRVVMEMQANRGPVVPVRVRPAPVYVVEPYPPPVAVGVGVGYRY